MPMKIASLKWEVKILWFEAADHQEKSKVCPEQFKTNWSDAEMFVVKPIRQDSLVFKYCQFFFATRSHFMFELSWFYGKREQFVFSNPVKSLC